MPATLAATGPNGTAVVTTKYPTRDLVLVGVTLTAPGGTTRPVFSRAGPAAQAPELTGLAYLEARRAAGLTS